MPEIKAIETRYKGYRFRSRLEARWAVFFDALGIEWEYEKEGFDLGKIGYYLPDFYFPKQCTWGEVKPKHATIEERIDAALKLGALSLMTGEATIFLTGMPENHSYQMCQYIGPEDVLSTDICFHIHSFGTFYDLRLGNSECTKWDDVEKASNKAKSARFEHGESG